MSVRGKFKLVQICSLSWNTGAKELKFNAVCSDDTDENKKFHKYTPSGTITMTVDNPEAMEQFELGKDYYVDFLPIPEGK